MGCLSERTYEALQACLERAPPAKQYYNDAFSVYDTLYFILWGALWNVGGQTRNALSRSCQWNLRHYLKWLARKSWYFSQRMQALAGNLRLFIYCYNHRQIM